MSLATRESLEKSDINYTCEYDKTLLLPISREEGREGLDLSFIQSQLSQYSCDIWNAYELSWLKPNGIPQVAAGVIYFPAYSPFLIDPRSLKLYFNSFNMSYIQSSDDFKRIVENDLSEAVQAPVSVKLYNMLDSKLKQIKPYAEIGQIVLEDAVSNSCFDDPIEYKGVNRNYLKDFLVTQEHTHVEETLCTHLLKSNCPVTGQPDWATLFISYTGQQINRKNLLYYILSYRTQNEYHEQCIEQIYSDIYKYCQLSLLTVYAKYTRRGGLDINPFRSNWEPIKEISREWRQ